VFQNLDQSASEKYKEGKFILEKNLIKKHLWN
jgi:hypothetical protein